MVQEYLYVVMVGINVFIEKYIIREIIELFLLEISVPCINFKMTADGFSSVVSNDMLNFT